MRRPPVRRLHTLAVTFVSLGLFWSTSALADVIAGWDVTGLSGYGPSPFTPTATHANVAIGGLTRGSGVGTSGLAAGSAWGGTNWQAANETAAVSSGNYATFSITANSGYQVSFSAISKFNYRRSGTGASTGVLQYQVGGASFVDAATLTYSSTSSSGASLGAIDLSSIAALQNVPAGTSVTFRIVNWGGTSTSGTWYIDDVSSGDDLEISGTVAVGAGSVNGACGSANGGTFSVAPNTNLCSIGTPSSVTGTGPWSWSCAGSGGGSTASCSANAASTQPLTVFHMNDVHARLTPHP